MPRRSPELQFTLYQHEMLEGLIFSDAHISDHLFFKFSFCQTERRLEYVEFVKHELEFNTKISFFASNKSYSIEKSNIVFKEYRKRWYSERKKIIPKDFKLTSTTCTHLYLGDGTRHQDNSTLILCTNSFLKENVEEILLPQLHKLNIECWMVRAERKYWMVYIPRRSVNTFLDYIGPSPVKCFQYKYERTY